MMLFRRFSLGLVLAAAVSQVALAGTISLTPSKDNTLIQTTDPNAQRSNGQGDIFVGRTNQDGAGPATISIRRGLVRFDLSSIPAGSTILSTSLAMRDVMGLNGDPEVSLHRLLQDWGEGTSFQAGGQGAPATAGDATWLYTFFDAVVPTSSPTWDTSGGSFSPTVSAATLVSDDLGGGQTFMWTSPQLTADVQFWLDHPAENFGWIAMGDETTGQTAKRFNSHESVIPPNLPPALVIEYLVPEPSSIALVIVGASCVSALFLYRRRRPHHVQA